MSPPRDTPDWGSTVGSGGSRAGRTGRTRRLTTCFSEAQLVTDHLSRSSTTNGPPLRSDTLARPSSQLIVLVQCRLDSRNVVRKREVVGSVEPSIVVEPAFEVDYSCADGLQPIGSRLSRRLARRRSVRIPRENLQAMTESRTAFSFSRSISIEALSSTVPGRGLPRYRRGDTRERTSIRKGDPHPGSPSRTPAPVR